MKDYKKFKCAPIGNRTQVNTLEEYYSTIKL